MKYDDDMRQKAFEVLVVVIDGMGSTYVNVGKCLLYQDFKTNNKTIQNFIEN